MRPCVVGAYPVLFPHPTSRRMGPPGLDRPLMSTRTWQRGGARRRGTAVADRPDCVSRRTAHLTALAPMQAERVKRRNDLMMPGAEGERGPVTARRCHHGGAAVATRQGGRGPNSQPADGVHVAGPGSGAQPQRCNARACGDYVHACDRPRGGGGALPSVSWAFQRRVGLPGRVGDSGGTWIHPQCTRWLPRTVSNRAPPL